MYLILANKYTRKIKLKYKKSNYTSVPININDMIRSNLIKLPNSK